MSEIKSLRYFSKSQLDPLYEVFNILDDTEHQQYKNLQNDLKAIDSSELENYVSEKYINELIGNIENKEMVQRAYYFIYLLRTQIALELKETLISTKLRPRPYDSSNLKSIDVKKNNLVSINEFSLDRIGLKYGEKVYLICPITETSNSSFWVTQVIFKLHGLYDINFKIRLDPFKEIPKDTFNPMFYKMQVHGKPLDWKRISSLVNDDFGQWFNDKEYNKEGFTDYVWSPKKDGTIHFTCEEVPKWNYSGLKSSRYFHAIFNKNTKKVSHCDGAIRYYTDEELKNRLKFQVKDPEARKTGKRIKIFQFDSKENGGFELDQSSFSDLAINFFVWNNDVIEYFN